VAVVTPAGYEHSKVDNQHPIRHNSFICSRCKMPGQYDELVGGSGGMSLRPHRRGIGMYALLISRRRGLDQAKATSEDLVAEAWDINLQICDKVQEDGEAG
jgi:hypothetical protein